MDFFFSFWVRVNFKLFKLQKLYDHFHVLYLANKRQSCKQWWSIQNLKILFLKLPFQAFVYVLLLSSILKWIFKNFISMEITNVIETTACHPTTNRRVEGNIDSLAPRWNYCLTRSRGQYFKVFSLSFVVIFPRQNPFYKILK